MRQLVVSLLLRWPGLSVRGFVLTHPGRGTHTYLHARAAFGPEAGDIGRGSRGVGEPT